MQERRHPHGDELELPDELPVRKRHAARIVWVAAAVLAALGAFQFLGAAASPNDKRLGAYLTRAVVPLAEPWRAPSGRVAR